MKPDHEINGRYFVEGEVFFHPQFCTKVIYERSSNDIILNHDLIDLNQASGKCFVEVERKILDDLILNVCKVDYRIKLIDGKAVVLTELPESVCYPSEDYYCKICDTKVDKPCVDKPYCQATNYSIYPDLSKQKSDDELADNIVDEVIAIISSDIRYQLKSSMQEYHRRKSEGLFTKEDLENAFNDARLTHPMVGVKYDTINDWLETRKKK